MESPSPVQPPAASHPTISRIAALVWTLVIFATIYFCFFTRLDVIGLVGPDEPRYAWIARDMAESGDFITPRLYGKPWFEKPPLYYWSAALSFKLFGVSETSARLPSAFFALLATLAMAWLAWRTWGAETARWLLLLLPTSVGMIGFSHAAATDMPFAATLTVALAAAAVLLDPLPRTAPSASSAFQAFSLTKWSIAFGVFLGLAVLAKGPAALILFGGTVLFWAVVTKRWHEALRLLQPMGIAAFCVTALPWYLLCAIRNPDFLRIFIIEHNFKRFLTPEFQHIQPFWYYAEIILIAFLPWTAMLLWALVTGANRLRRTAPGSRTIFLLCWSIFCVAFFTLSRSKLPGYILPALPPIGLLLARCCTLLGSVKRWLLVLSTLAFSAVGAAGFFAISRNPEAILRKAMMFRSLVLLFLLLLVVSNLFFAILVFRRRPTSVLFAVLPFFLAFRAFDFAAASTPLSIVSPRYAAYQVQAEQIPLGQLRFFNLRRATLYGVDFYLRSDLQEWDQNAAREVYVLTDKLRCSMKPAEMNCDDLWGEQGNILGFDVLHLTPKH